MIPVQFMHLFYLETKPTACYFSSGLHRALFASELGVINHTTGSTIVIALFKTLCTGIIKIHYPDLLLNRMGGNRNTWGGWGEKDEDKTPL